MRLRGIVTASAFILSIGCRHQESVRPETVITSAQPAPLRPIRTGVFGTRGFNAAGSISALAFSGDCRFLATAFTDGRVGIWDVSNGHLLRQFRAHSQAIKFIKYLGYSSTLLVAKGVAVELWDGLEGKRTKRLGEHSSLIIGLGVNASGTLSASASTDGDVVLWDLQRQQPMRRWNCRTEIASMALSLSGKMLITGGAWGGVSQWDTESGDLIRKIETAPTAIELCVIYSDNKPFAFQEHPGQVRCISTVELDRNGDPSSTQCNIGVFAVTSMVYGRNGERILIPQWPNTIAVLDPRTGQIVPTRISLDSEATVIALSSDGALLAAAQEQGPLQVFNAATYKALGSGVGHFAGLLDVQWRSDSEVMTVGLDRQIINWDLRANVVTSTNKEGRLSRPVAFSHGGALVHGNGPSEVMLCDNAGACCTSILKTGDVCVSSGCWSPDGSVVAVGCQDGSVHVLFQGSVSRNMSFRGRSQRVEVIAISPDNKHAVLGYSGSLAVYALSQRTLLVSVQLQDDRPPRIAISPNGAFLAYSGEGGTCITIVPLSALSGGATLQVDRRVSALCFSNDSRILFTGNDSGELMCWEVATRNAGLNLGKHDGHIELIKVSPRGGHIATAGTDARLGIWSYISEGRECNGASVIEQLCSRDFRVAYKAICSVVLSGEVLHDIVGKVFEANQQTVISLIGVLSSEDLSERESATNALLEMDTTAEAVLEEVLNQAETTTEVRGRIREILGRIRNPGFAPSAGALRRIRLLHALELCDPRYFQECLPKLKQSASFTIRSEVAQIEARRFRGDALR